VSACKQTERGAFREISGKGHTLHLDISPSEGLPFSTKPNETERNLTKPSDYYRQMCYKNVSNSNINEGPSSGSRAAAAVADGCRKVV